MRFQAKIWQFKLIYAHDCISIFFMLIPCNQTNPDGQLPPPFPPPPPPPQLHHHLHHHLVLHSTFSRYEQEFLKDHHFEQFFTWLLPSTTPPPPPPPPQLHLNHHLLHIVLTHYWQKCVNELSPPYQFVQFFH